MDDYDETTQDQTTQTPEPEDDLRAIISEQFKDDGQDGGEVDDQGGQEGERPRDETGKFVAKDKAPAPTGDKPQPTGTVPPATGDKEPVQQEGWNADKAPQSWTPKARERWSAIPADIRQEIVRREEASVAGVRQLQEQFAPYRQFADNLAPFINEAMQNRVDPAGYINNVLSAERGLRMGTDEQRFEALVRIADAYNIPLRKALNELAGSEVIPPAPQQMQLPPEIQRELMEARQFRQQYESQQQQQGEEMSPELKEFSSKSEFFEDVRLDMADLIEQGLATDLQDAYDQACWRNKGVRELLLERRDKQGKVKEKQQKASGLNHTSTNTAEVDVQTNKDDDDDDIYESVRKSVQALNSRV